MCGFFFLSDKSIPPILRLRHERSVSVAASFLQGEIKKRMRGFILHMRFASLSAKSPMPINRNISGMQQKGKLIVDLPLTIVYWGRMNHLLHQVAHTARILSATSITPALPLVFSGTPLYNRNVVVDSLTVTCRCSVHLARAWKCFYTFRSRRLFNFHLFLIIAFFK
jgi:hypothetical protein